MKKHRFYPIWKLEEIETELSSMERQGWRLSRLFGLYGFEFAKSQPKNAQYFLIYSIPRGPDMLDIEHDIKSQNGANLIADGFSSVGMVKAYRITQECDLHVRKMQRDQYLRGMMLYNVGLWLISLVISLLGFLSAVWTGKPAWIVMVLFGLLLTASVAADGYYLIAWWKLKRKQR